MYFHTFWWSYLWWHRGTVWARFMLTIMIEWHLDCDEFYLLMSCHTKGDMQDFIKRNMWIIIFITSRMRKLVCEQLLLAGMKSLSDTLPPKRNHSQAPFLILDDMLWRKDGIKQICLDMQHDACMRAWQIATFQICPNFYGIKQVGVGSHQFRSSPLSPTH